jgi:glycosyltransferase involved in cell wall biosynthesis
MKLSKPNKRAAHFLRLPLLACTPSNDAIVRALLDLGYVVDLYAPGGVSEVKHCKAWFDRYGTKVGEGSVEYGKRWILKNVFSHHWRQYSVFSGTTEDPMAVVGLLSWIHRRPSFTAADEIFSGSYRGDSSERWKNLCRWGMRRSRLTIVNDASRIALQREYAGLSVDHPVIVYPNCFLRPPLPGNRTDLRRNWGMPENALILLSSGYFDSNAGVEWLVHALQAKPDLHVVVQPGPSGDRLSKFLLRHCHGSERLYLEDQVITWEEVYASVAAADIGMSIYLHTGPQFQNMGISSNKLCTYLSMGIPVIASKQPSFDFVEKYNCGVLVDNDREFVEAIGVIQQRLAEMKANAIRCAKEYIDTSTKYADLLSALKRVVTH